MVRTIPVQYDFLPDTEKRTLSVRRLSAAVTAALVAVMLLAPASFAASSKPASEAVPRVVFIVGPAGAATDGYRAQARAAAAVARKYTPDVVELYSPDATWPAVKQALAGASLVVYMGHGNGWPSRYSDSLFPLRQDGLGLNPKTGGNDYTHQYFGEGPVGSQVKLAKDAVVLLNHLCYASGNSEPGLPEGSFDQAKQRVDNYAAGFIQAGASAVIAEAWSSPSYFVNAVLGGGRSIQSAWQNAPSANDHQLAFPSVRSAGYVAQMDPETVTSGFTRSIVMKTGLAPRDVLAGATGSPNAPAIPVTPPLEPTLLGIGLTLSAPDIRQLPSAGTAGHVDLQLKVKDRKVLPKGMEASARWDPIDVAASAPNVTPVASPIATASAKPAASPAPTAVPPGTSRSVPGVPVAAAPATDPGPAPSDPVIDLQPRIDPPAESIDLVVAERQGDVVAPTAVKFSKTAMVVPVTMPSVPGRYRLTITLHDADGVAYDAATQALIPPLIVRVTGEFDGAIQAAPTAALTAGTGVQFGVRAVNLGVTAWGRKAVESVLDYLNKAVPDQPAKVVARWLPLSIGAVLPTDANVETVTATLPIGLAPGGSAAVVLGLTAPSAPGDYLLVLDIVTPEHGSLVASGADPTLVRVTVLAAR